LDVAVRPILTTIVEKERHS